MGIPFTKVSDIRKGLIETRDVSAISAIMERKPKSKECARKTRDLDSINKVQKMVEEGLRVNWRIYLDVMKDVVVPWCISVANAAKTCSRRLLNLEHAFCTLLSLASLQPRL